MAPAQPQIVAALSQKLLAWHKELPPSPPDPDAGQDGYPWPGTKRVVESAVE